MWSELAPGTVPNGLAPSEVDRHISGRLGAELSTMAGHSSRLGGIEWTGTSLFKAGDDWRSAEEKTMAAPMAGWIEETK
jgi:hypothetical protein